MAHTKDSAPAHPSREHEHLAHLEGRYRHELLSADEHEELRDRVLRLRRRLRLSPPRFPLSRGQVPMSIPGEGSTTYRYYRDFLASS